MSVISRASSAFGLRCRIPATGLPRILAQRTPAFDRLLPRPGYVSRRLRSASPSRPAHPLLGVLSCCDRAHCRHAFQGKDGTDCNKSVHRTGGERTDRRESVRCESPTKCGASSLRWSQPGDGRSRSASSRQSRSSKHLRRRIGPILTRIVEFLWGYTSDAFRTSCVRMPTPGRSQRRRDFCFTNYTRKGVI